MYPILFSILIVLLTIVLHITHAQPSSSPYPVQEFSYSLVGSNLFIYGGKFMNNDLSTHYVNYTNQFFSLDLTTSWDVNSAPWKQLNGAEYNNIWNFHGHASPDNSTFIASTNYLNETIFNSYSLVSGSWSGIRTIPSDLFFLCHRPCDGSDLWYYLHSFVQWNNIIQHILLDYLSDI
jgi:hypothetical protein